MITLGQTKTNSLWYHLRKLKRDSRELDLQSKNRLTDVEKQTDGYQAEKGKGRDKLGLGLKHIYYCTENR